MFAKQGLMTDDHDDFVKWAVPDILLLALAVDEDGTRVDETIGATGFQDSINSYGELDFDHLAAFKTQPTMAKLAT